VVEVKHKEAKVVYHQSHFLLVKVDLLSKVALLHLKEEQVVVQVILEVEVDQEILTQTVLVEEVLPITDIHK